MAAWFAVRGGQPFCETALMEPRALFTGIAGRYDRPAEWLSLGGYGRWRRALVEGLRLGARARVLDVATGTGLIARDLEARGHTVVGVDLTEAMLARAGGMRAAADARALPFRDAAFDALTFSYLLRYVGDPEATLRELARVVRSGGRIGSVEFGLPRARTTRAGWRVYARGVFPIACRWLGDGWAKVGAFLPGSIERWIHEWPLERQRDAWRASGIDVQITELMLGAGVVIVGTKR